MLALVTLNNVNRCRLTPRFARQKLLSGCEAAPKVKARASAEGYSLWHSTWLPLDGTLLNLLT